MKVDYGCIHNLYSYFICYKELLVYRCCELQDGVICSDFYAWSQLFSGQVTS